jgi:hypothetical protein
MRATVKVAPTNVLVVPAFVGATFTVALFAQIIYRMEFRNPVNTPSVKKPFFDKKHQKKAFLLRGIQRLKIIRYLKI